MSEADRTVKLTWQDLTDAELRQMLARAKTGIDREAALTLIRFFHRRIRDNLPYDQTLLLDYLEHAFGGILEGKPPEQALGL